MCNSLTKSYKVRILLTVQCLNASTVSTIRAQRRAANQLIIAPMVLLIQMLTHIMTQFIHTLAGSPPSQYFMLPPALLFSTMIINHAGQELLARQLGTQAETELPFSLHAKDVVPLQQSQLNPTSKTAGTK